MTKKTHCPEFLLEPQNVEPLFRRADGLRAPFPFSFAINGELVLVTENKRGNREDVIISRFPVYLHAIEQSESGRVESFVFKQFLPKRGWFDVVLKPSDLSVGRICTVFAAIGVMIYDPRLFLDFVRRSIDDFHARSS